MDYFRLYWKSYGHNETEHKSNSFKFTLGIDNENLNEQKSEKYSQSALLKMTRKIVRFNYINSFYGLIN